MCFRRIMKQPKYTKREIQEIECRNIPVEWEKVPFWIKVKWILQGFDVDIRNSTGPK